MPPAFALSQDQTLRFITAQELPQARNPPSHNEQTPAKPLHKTCVSRIHPARTPGHPVPKAPRSRKPRTRLIADTRDTIPDRKTRPETYPNTQPNPAPGPRSPGTNQRRRPRTPSTQIHLSRNNRIAANPAAPTVACAPDPGQKKQLAAVLAQTSPPRRSQEIVRPPASVKPSPDAPLLACHTENHAAKRATPSASRVRGTKPASARSPADIGQRFRNIGSRSGRVTRYAGRPSETSSNRISSLTVSLCVLPMLNSLAGGSAPWSSGGWSRQPSTPATTSSMNVKSRRTAPPS